MISNINYNYQPIFGANLNSSKLKLRRKDFYIKIPGYGKNFFWAERMKRTTNYITDMIRKGMPVETVLRCASAGVVSANYLTRDFAKKIATGILRTQRMGWKNRHSDFDAFTPYKLGPYKVYEKQLDATYLLPLTPINRDLAMSTPDGFGEIVHGHPRLINNSLDYIFDLFNNKYTKFLKKDVKAEDLNEIIDVVAEIRWIIAHATPWLRGSDAISNVFMRAMLKAVGVKASSPAKGISFDLEAYCNELPAYKSKFNSYFEKPLRVIE